MLQHIPNIKQKPCTQDSSGNVDQDGRVISHKGNELAEDNLAHLVSRIDVKHIDDSVGADQMVDEGCCYAEDQVEQ